MASEKQTAKRLGVVVRHIHFGMFDFGLTLVTGPLEAAVKFASWKHDGYCHGEPTDPRGLTFWRQGYAPVIWIPRLPQTPREHGTLAHEMLHAVVWLAKWAGFRLGNDSEETFCHALGYGVTEAITALRAKS